MNFEAIFNATKTLRDKSNPLHSQVLGKSFQWYMEVQKWTLGAKVIAR